jgi:hypothetical protein
MTNKTGISHDKQELYQYNHITGHLICWIGGWMEEKKLHTEFYKKNLLVRSQLEA